MAGIRYPHEHSHQGTPPETHPILSIGIPLYPVEHPCNCCKASAPGPGDRVQAMLVILPDTSYRGHGLAITNNSYREQQEALASLVQV